MDRPAPTSTAPRTAPVVTGLPLVGPLFEMRRDYLGLMSRVAAEYGDIARMRIGPVTAHLLNHPDHVHHVLVEHFRNYQKKTRGYAAMRRIVGEGLVTSEGAFWQRQRRIAQPAFKRSTVSGFDAKMVQAAEAMVQRWQPAMANGTPIDVAAEMMRSP